MNNFKRILKLIVVVLMAGIFFLSGIQPVSAATKSDYFLSFLYNAETQTFGSIVVANPGRDRLENEYSDLDTTAPLITLSSNGSGLFKPSEANMRKGDYLSSYPFSFPEDNEGVKGTQADYTQAVNVGNNLTNSLNNAIKFILKPVSTSGRKDLRLNEYKIYLNLAMTISNSGYAVIANNNTSFQRSTFNEKLE